MTEGLSKLSLGEQRNIRGYVRRVYEEKCQKLKNAIADERRTERDKILKEFYRTPEGKLWKKVKAVDAQKEKLDAKRKVLIDNFNKKIKRKSHKKVYSTDDLFYCGPLRNYKTTSQKKLDEVVKIYHEIEKSLIFAGHEEAQKLVEKLNSIEV
jgi:hypothetical protein